MAKIKSATLLDAIRAGLQNQASKLHVALPGRVENYDAATQTCSVQPLLPKIFVGEEDKLLLRMPVISNVPVVFPRAGNFFMSFPLQKGQHVLLVVVEQSLEEWIRTQQGEEWFKKTSELNPEVPYEVRDHHLSDAVAIPGLYPIPAALQNADADDVVLGYDTDLLLHIRQSEVEWVRPGKAQQSVAVSEPLETLYGSARSTYASHTHATAFGPSGTPLTPNDTLPSWNPAINSAHILLPEN